MTYRVIDVGALQRFGSRGNTLDISDNEALEVGLNKMEKAKHTLVHVIPATSATSVRFIFHTDRVGEDLSFLSQ